MVTYLLIGWRHYDVIGWRHKTTSGLKSPYCLYSILSTHYRPYPVIVAIRPRTHMVRAVHISLHHPPWQLILPTLTSATSLPIGLPSWSWDWTRLIMLIRLLPTIRSLERRARYLFYCMFFCFFVRSPISRQPAGRFAPKFACGRTLVPDVSSPLLGVSGPGRAEKGGKWNFRYYGSQWEIFAFWCFLSDISATRGRIHTKFYMYDETTQSCAALAARKRKSASFWLESLWSVFTFTSSSFRKTCYVVSIFTVGYELDKHYSFTGCLPCYVILVFCLFSTWSFVRLSVCPSVRLSPVLSTSYFENE